MPLTTSLRVWLDTELSVALDLSIPTDRMNYLKAISLLTGVAAGQADKIFHDKRTLGPAGTENIDFAGGLTDPFGVALTFVKLKGLLIYCDPANVNNLRVFRPAANGVPIFLAASGEISPIPPGGLFLGMWPDLAGIAIVAGTGDLLTLTNAAGGTSVIYDIIAIGTSA